MASYTAPSANGRKHALAQSQPAARFEAGVVDRDAPASCALSRATRGPRIVGRRARRLKRFRSASVESPEVPTRTQGVRDHNRQLAHADSLRDHLDVRTAERNA